jgi:hypothetical protein
MRFAPTERRLLLSVPGIGEGVVTRLEQAGIGSLARLRAIGVDEAVRAVESQLGRDAWSNRRRPLVQVLNVVQVRGPEVVRTDPCSGLDDGQGGPRTLRGGRPRPAAP